jgi:cytochrome c553
MPCLRLLMVLLLLAVPPWLHAAPPESVPTADDMAPRVLACVACHGREGRATNQGYFPRIAGKPAGYLYNQLRNFRDGRRSYPAMNGLLEYLSDDYLMEMASYFSRMDVPYPAPQTHNAAPAVLERGRQLVQQGDAAQGVPACVACHGTALTGVQKAIPGLVGLPRDYLNAQLGAWQAGQRHAHAPDCMANIARRLTPADVSAVSTWLSSQPVAGGGKPAAQLPGPLPVACGGLEGGAR